MTSHQQFSPTFFVSLASPSLLADPHQHMKLLFSLLLWKNIYIPTAVFTITSSYQCVFLLPFMTRILETVVYTSILLSFYSVPSFSLKPVPPRPPSHNSPVSFDLWVAFEFFFWNAFNSFLRYQTLLIFLLNYCLTLFSLLCWRRLIIS